MKFDPFLAQNKRFSAFFQFPAAQLSSICENLRNLWMHPLFPFMPQAAHGGGFRDFAVGEGLLGPKMV